MDYTGYFLCAFQLFYESAGRGGGRPSFCVFLLLVLASLLGDGFGMLN